MARPGRITDPALVGALVWPVVVRLPAGGGTPVPAGVLLVTTVVGTPVPAGAEAAEEAGAEVAGAELAGAELAGAELAGAEV